MKFLDTRLSALFVILYCYNFNLFGMDLIDTRNKVQPHQSHNRLSSLRDLCIRPAARYIQRTDDLHKLIYFPTNCATDIILSLGSLWIAVNKNREKFLQFALLRMDVICSVVEKLADVRLAYDISKLGKVTSTVASIIVEEFLKTNLKIASRNFKDLVDKKFPNEILSRGNYAIFYKMLLNALTEKHWFTTVNETQNEVKKKLFTYDSFCMDLPLKHLSRYINVSAHEGVCCATVDVERNFLVAYYKQQYIKMYNLKNGCVFGFTVPFEVKQVILDHKNLGHLGILDVSNVIHVVEIPLKLLQGYVPLYSIALLVYTKTHIHKKISQISTDTEHVIVDEGHDSAEEDLAKLIQKTIELDDIQLSFCKELYFDQCELKKICLPKKQLKG
jgi:hypothetical protein